MTTMNGDSSPDTEVSLDSYFSFLNSNYQEEMLVSLNALRKSGEFCDVKFIVDDHEFPAHRAVLATCSPLLFDMFTKGDKSATLEMFKLKDIDFTSFEHLLTYMYTGRMNVPPEEVQPLYVTALRLKMDLASRACANFLAAKLSPVNCLDIRTSLLDSEFRRQLDQYIETNIEEVKNTKQFYNLPRVQVEVVGADDNLLNSSNRHHLFELVLDWAHNTLDSHKAKIDFITEQVNVLLLSSDNTLQNVTDTDEIENLKQDEVVQDYKKLIRRQSGLNRGRDSVDSNSSSNSGGQPFHKFSINPETPPIQQNEWTVIACYRNAGHTYLALVMLNGKLAMISLHFRIPQLSPYNSGSEGSESPVSVGSQPKFNMFDRHQTLNPLPTMNTPRCGFGLRAVAGRMIACGGYNRGDIMGSAEEYTLETNEWRPLPNMMVARGRHATAQLDGKVYAIGGSDGHTELMSVEYYDPVKNSWTLVADLLEGRSSPGVAVLKGKVYCIGGSMGQNPVKKCEVFDSDSNSWKRISPLNTARFQAAVRAFKGRLYAIGGSDGWNCLNSVEVYNPEFDTWEFARHLNVPRRGAGIENVNGKLFVIGGSDGTRSLESTEVLDPEDGIWNFGPPMTACRANVGASFLEGRLFAVGGFSGKHFLDTMEYLEAASGEWSCYTPVHKTPDLPCDTNTSSDVVRRTNGENRMRQNGSTTNGSKCDVTPTTAKIIIGH
ncbi:influenza virus NS1A-binding protein homolog isoform X2 [Gigantopelta aegis]|nr:influenza virus NS1A-binding protein homolog isoform X2 [Gigantopelta aegis]XP_041371032.1 influenza virus NS1A-binding protein homolog isoform X2 [Gigantopelta aegis]